MKKSTKNHNSNERILNLVLLLVIVISFGASCKKEKNIIETIQLSRITYLNVPTEYDVVEIRFLNELLGFALCEENSIEKGTNESHIELYKTTNGGATWSKEDLPVTTGTRIRGFEMQSESSGGIMIDNYFYHKSPMNIGSEWQLIYENNFPLIISSIAKTTDNILCFTKDRSVDLVTEIYEWVENTPNYNLIGEFSRGFSDLDGGVIIDSTYYFYEEFQSESDSMIAIQLPSLTKKFHPHMGSFSYNNRIGHNFDIQNGYTLISNIYGEVALYYPKGISNVLTGNEYEYYFHHQLPYYGVRFIDDFAVAVGNKTIASNHTGPWKEVFKENKTNYKECFLDVLRRNQTSIFVSGTNGTCAIIEFI
jgi:hypothetical protein